MESLDDLYASVQRTAVSANERSILVPALVGQLGAVRKLLEEIQTTAREAVPEEIATALYTVLPPPKGNVPIAEVTAFLARTATQISTDFLAAIDTLTRDAASLPTVDALGGWLVRVNAFASTITLSKTRLFIRSFNSIPYFKNVETGEIRIPNALMLQVGLVQFSDTLEECARIAKSMQVSITHLFERRQEEVKHLLQLRVARANEAGSIAILRFQRWLVVFSIIFGAAMAMLPAWWDRVTAMLSP